MRVLRDLRNLYANLNPLDTGEFGLKKGIPAQLRAMVIHAAQYGALSET